ncbi:hypothetical protein [Paracoccus sp. ME4]|uniref:hypothetical protein n=1 Tax=Paracoccus sp. ME4 TaxID=3138066 RepID=UPI00398A9C1A
MMPQWPNPRFPHHGIEEIGLGSVNLGETASHAPSWPHETRVFAKPRDPGGLFFDAENAAGLRDRIIDASADIVREFDLEAANPREHAELGMDGDDDFEP